MKTQTRNSDVSTHAFEVSDAPDARETVTELPPACTVSSGLKLSALHKNVST